MPMRNRFDGFLAGALGLVVFGAVALCAQSPVDAQAERERVRQLNFMTMPAAAKAAGRHYVRDMTVGNWMVADSLESIAKVSELVVVGVVTSTQPSLSKDQMYISTASSVRVTEVIKGDAQPGSQVKVVTVGGRLSFPDGTSAETATPGMEPLRQGGRYVLFLERIEKGTRPELLTAEEQSGFVPKLGPQGIFELRDKGGVKAQGRAVDVVSRQNDGSSVDLFLTKVRLLKGGAQPH